MKKIVKIGQKCFEAQGTISVNGKIKYIIAGLGTFFEDEIEEPSMREKFLYYIYGTRGRSGA